MEFEEFAAARLPALLRYAGVLTGDRELARDVVQEVLARALVKWRRIGDVAEPYAYVRTMVTNEYLSLRRRRTIHTVALLHDAHDGPADADGFADRPSTDDPLWHRLAELPRQQRAVIVLRYYEDLTDVEIADVLGCRAATVRAYASRALATLRVEIDRDGLGRSDNGGTDVSRAETSRTGSSRTDIGRTDIGRTDIVNAQGA